MFVVRRCGLSLLRAVWCCCRWVMVVVVCSLVSWCGAVVVDCWRWFVVVVCGLL